MAYEEWQPLDMFPLIAGGCCIYPPWQPAPPVRDNRHIVLDPGVVFGSGSHATTHDCLKAMALLIEQEGPLPESAIDIGTGTGLLALAAARRGIPRIVGVDNNFLAAQTAKKNAAMNDLEDNIVIVKGRAADFTHMPFDLLIANIHYEAMRNLIAADNLLNYKYFILSGLLRSPARKVLARLDKLPVKTIKVWNKNKIWCTIIGKCFD